MVYGSFWQRLLSVIIDSLVGMVIHALAFLTMSFSFLLLLTWPNADRGLSVFWSLFYDVAGIAYPIYCHGRWGQTLGKWVAHLRVVDLSGEPISWRQSFLRSSVDIGIAIALAIGWVIAFLRAAPEAHRTVPPHLLTVQTHDPFRVVAHRLILARMIWYWSEPVVVLFNRKRRALHDFIAGTVVVRIKRQPRERMENGPLLYEYLQDTP